MGTNYIVELNKCECCNRSDKIQIGKSSYGWAFNFRGYKNTYGEIETDDNIYIKVPADFELVSWNQWKEFLKDKSIFDEYGETISFDDFVTYVEGCKSPDYTDAYGHKNKDHIDCVLNEPKWYDESYRDENLHWHDENGYSFSRRYFF